MVAIVEKNLGAIVGLCQRYRVRSLELFGSAATGRGFDPARSDVDFLVEFLPLEPTEHAEAYFGLLRALDGLFQRQVDLVEATAISNPYFLTAVNQSRSLLYAA
jgi:predicted nucleotidyltransferase